MKKRFFATFVLLFLVASAVTAAFTCINASADDEAVIVLAGSDFQAITDEVGCANTRALISAIKKAGFASPTGFLFAGDYNNGSDDKTGEIAALKDAVKQEYPDLKDENMIFTQGNHDPASSKGLSKSGANDTEHYGVFVIHEDEFMQGSTSESTVKKTAASLEKYLGAKSESGYKKPIFVISHIPLHYSWRTPEGGDGVYSQYLIDVLNKYGETLNIIFMFGHNHSSSYDDYLGASAIYLEKGDSVYICEKGDKEAAPTLQTINFTYMNAGYVGYANCLGYMLTMTVFEIKDDIVRIYRYNSDGSYPLKDKGDWSTNDEKGIMYGKNDDYLEIYYNTPGYAGSTAADNGVRVVSSGINSLSVKKNTSPSCPAVQSAYAYYDITAKGITKGMFTAVSITLDESFDISRPVFVRDVASNQTKMCWADGGKIVFETDELSSYEVTQNRNVTTAEYTLRAFTLAPVLEYGKDYLFITENTDGKAYAMRHTEKDGLTFAEVSLKNGFASVYLMSFDNSLLWSFEDATDKVNSSGMGTLCNKVSGSYLVSSDGSDLMAEKEISTEYFAWRLSSGAYGLFTVSADDIETRYYVKHGESFFASDSDGDTTRVYAYTENLCKVTVEGYIDSVAGSVALGDQYSPTGSKIYLLGEDGTERIMDVTPSMLKTADGNSVSLDTEGVYSDLSVYYNDIVICSDYTLSVGREASFPSAGNENVSVPEESTEVSEEDILSDVSIYHSPNESHPAEAPVESRQDTVVWYIAGGVAPVVIAVIAAVLIKKRK